MSAGPLLYSYLTDALDSQLPSTLIRVILSLSDVLRLPLTDVRLQALPINVKTDLLPTLSGRYGADWDHLTVGTRVDVKTPSGR